MPPVSQSPKVLRVFVLDDHPLARAGLTEIVSGEADMEVCGETGRGRGSVDMIARANPDVILLDLSLKDCSGLELIKDLRAMGVKTPILVVSMHHESLYAERVIRARANGYVMKSEASSSVVEGIRAVAKGEVFLSPEMSWQLLRRMTGKNGESKPPDKTMAQLSDREFEVFTLLGRGLSSGEVAEVLGISRKTVDAHRTRIKDRLGIANSSELIRSAVQFCEKDTGPRPE